MTHDAPSGPQYARETSFEQAEAVRASVASAARFLPAQGPIGVFIAQNMLQAFEGVPFESAVCEAASLYGTEPFLTESRYRRELAEGRIRGADLEAVLDAELAGRADEPLAAGKLVLRDLHLALLLHSVRREDDAAVRWTLTERDVVDRLRDDLAPEIRWRLVSESRGGLQATEATGTADGADDPQPLPGMFGGAGIGDRDDERRAASELWQACVEAVAMTRMPPHGRRPPVRPRDLILAIDPTLDTDALVHPLLIRLCAAFLDQGVAAWPMPDRDRGLFQAVAQLYGGRFGPFAPWSRRLPEAFHAARGMATAEVVVAELCRLGIPRSEWDEFLARSVLALRGWAGMISHLEQRPDRAPVEAVPASLLDFVALRLVCDRVATEWAAGRLAGGPRRASPLPVLWTELRDRHPAARGPGSLARAFLLHQVAQIVGLTADDLRSLDENELMRLEWAIVSFDGWSRRRLFHLAYERRHRIETLDALAAHTRHAGPTPTPTVQAILCMDDRCESFRRHLEELGPRFETFGTAGFFGVPMYYRGVDDWHAAPRCPIVMRPRHTVVELPEASAQAAHRRQRAWRRRLGQVMAGATAGGHTLQRGGLFTAVAGALAAIPLVARVAFPDFVGRLGRRAAERTRRRVPTRLVLERSADETFCPDGTLAGFDVEEMTGIVRSVLEDIGLTSGFARLVAVIGHGSSSLNNPHESAYDCGACGGAPGGANARALALMANDPRVRARLAATGLVIPSDTSFVGGVLDTCADTVTWFDLDRQPERLRPDVERLQRACEHVCTADAHERCRRFESAPLDIAPADAAAHVRARSVDLAQVRPELGHATNATAVIGRRWKTRGLFLDRRAFLVSYDPTTDADGKILERTLAAVVPVAAGINLAYFFSAVDRLGYGCDTKLPHNVTGLIGVMDGHASDLRTGLPWQTVEIHEPLRLLTVIEATPECILAATAGLPGVRHLVENRWIQLVSWHPDTGSLMVFESGRFVPYAPERNDIPVVDRSGSWYGGRRDHLSPARVLAALPGRRSVPPAATRESSA